MTKEIKKKEILPRSSMPVAKGARDGDGKLVAPIDAKKYDAAGEIKKFGLQPTEMLEYRDPFSGALKKIMIDRRGTNDEKLALTLLDDTMTREQKDTVVSMYLFEKGNQGASMLMDLWAYKGAHTKESRAFQSTMRFDFELFLSVFQSFTMDTYDLIKKNIDFDIVQVEVEEDGKKFTKEVVKLNGKPDAETMATTMAEMARYFRMTGSLLTKRIRAEVEKRERAKGKGIYIGKDSKPYSVYEDGDIVEIVTKDREEAKAEREELIQHMSELTPEAMEFVLNLGKGVTWPLFLEEWTKANPDKPWKSARDGDF